MDTAIALSGLILALLVYGVLIIKYILEKVDTKHQQNQDSMIRLETDIRKDIKEISDTYVRRDDHVRHVEAVERQINSVVEMVNTMNRDITGRLDNLMSMITALVMNGKK